MKRHLGNNVVTDIDRFNFKVNYRYTFSNTFIIYYDRIMVVLLGSNGSLIVLKINISWPTDSHIKEYFIIHYITNCNSLCKFWNFAAFI